MALDTIQSTDSSFETKLAKALHAIRVGDYKTADEILQELRGYLPNAPVKLPVQPTDLDYSRLRLAILVAEVSEYHGRYKEARAALKPYAWIVEDLPVLEEEGENLTYLSAKDPRWLLLRQKLYFLWQTSVIHYRDGDSARSRELLDLAIRLANRLQPHSEALLTQLYYGSGKLAFHECNEVEAIRMYRESLVSASRRLDLARKERDGVPPAEESVKKFLEEAEAARYSVAKTLALGLGQCLREQGRLEEAHTQVVAGRLLLNLGIDRELSDYARVLLASIERSIAGEKEKPSFLRHAADQISACADHFKDHEGEIGFRSRLELALVLMQQGQLEEARGRLQAIVDATDAPKWRAEANLGLSRVARRLGRHADAVKYGERAVTASSDPGLVRIQRRAQVVYVLALYEAAVEPGADERLLHRVEEAIGSTLDPASAADVRTRANMLLTLARVHNTRHEAAKALEAFREYKALEHQVEVGRIKELAKTVEQELTEKAFYCPADLDTGAYDLDRNTDALSAYIIKKVMRQYGAINQQAAALGLKRGTYHKLRKRLAEAGLLPASAAHL